MDQREEIHPEAYCEMIEEEKYLQKELCTASVGEINKEFLDG
jgi:hypothetical protein